MVPQDMLWFFIDGRRILECEGEFFSDEITIVFMLPASQSVITNYITALVCIHMNLINMTIFD